MSNNHSRIHLSLLCVAALAATAAVVKKQRFIPILHRYTLCMKNNGELFILRI